MLLLDLPLEIFGPIIRHVTFSLGLRKAVKLRKVCRLVDELVMSAIEMDRLLDNGFQHRGTRDLEYGSYVPFIARFLERRPYAKQGACSGPNLSALLNKILDACDLGSSRDRIAGLEILLDMNSLDGSMFVRRTSLLALVVQGDLTLHREKRDFQWKQELLLPAAIVLKASHIYEPLVPALEDSVKLAPSVNRVVLTRLSSPSQLIGTPLFAAVMAGSSDLVRRILEFEPGLLLHSPLVNISAAITKGHQDVLQVLLQYEPPWNWTIQAAIVFSARKHRIDAARALLGYAADGARREGFKFNWALNEGLYWATVHRDRDMIRLFLDNGAEINAYLTVYQDVSPVPEEQLAYDPSNHYSVRRPTPLGVAAWAGDIDLMKWLIAEGAAVDGDEYCIAPIEGALHGDQLEALALLFGLGAGRNWACIRWLWNLQTCAKIHANRTFRYLLLERKVVKLASSNHSPDEKTVLTILVQDVCKFANAEAFDMLLEAGLPADEPVGHNEHTTLMFFAQFYESPETGGIRERLEALGVKRHHMQSPRCIADSATTSMPHGLLCIPARALASWGG